MLEPLFLLHSTSCLVQNSLCNLYFQREKKHRMKTAPKASALGKFPHVLFCFVLLQCKHTQLCYALEYHNGFWGLYLNRTETELQKQKKTEVNGLCFKPSSFVRMKIWIGCILQRQAMTYSLVSQHVICIASDLKLDQV